MTFSEFLDQHGVYWSTEGKDTRIGWIQLDCPECDGHNYLGYNEYGGYLNCWRCGKINLLKYIASICKEPWDVCKKILEEIPRQRIEDSLQIRGKLVIPPGVGPLKKIHKDYLRGRGYDPENLQKLWDLKGICLSGRLSWRIWIPVYFQGKILSWTTRSLSDLGTRYITAKKEEEAVPIKELLYGEDYCRHSIIVHEGPADVWATGPGSVATFGVVNSPAQLRRISKYPMRVICFDSETKAQARARSLCRNLSLYPGETRNVVLDAKDAGSASPAEIRKLRKFLQ